MASNGNFAFAIDFSGLEDFVRELGGDAKRDFDNHLEDGMKEYGSLLEEGGQALAGYDGGDLETSIQFDRFERSGNAMEGSVGSDLEYAWRRHEEEYREGEFDKYDAGVKYEEYYVDGRGEETREKDRTAWRGLPAGRKYLERAMVATEDDFNEIMGEVYDKTLRGLGR